MHHHEVILFFRSANSSFKYLSQISGTKTKLLEDNYYQLGEKHENLKIQEYYIFTDTEFLDVKMIYLFTFIFAIFPYILVKLIKVHEVVISFC